MLCQRCGAYVTSEDILCPSCGALLDKHGQDSGVRAIRQGRKQPAQPVEEPKRVAHRRSGASRAYTQPAAESTGKVYVDSALSGSTSPEMRAPVTYEENQAEGQNTESYDRPGRRSYGRKAARVQPVGAHAAKRRGNVHKVTRHMINWAHMAIAMACLAVLLMVGAYFYLTHTAEGQRIMARMGYKATSTALWEVGEEKMDVGDIDGAIADFLQAREQDGEENINVDGLLLLGSAYEANGMVTEAMDLYEEIYTDIVPNRPEAYRSMIRLLQAQDRDPEAAELMQVAYEKTEQTSFRTMRAELLPQTPVADLTAGLYSEKKYLTLTSPQGYDIYYTMDAEAELPTEGTLYTEPIFLDEGIWALRAVAISDDLVSDELTGTYKIIMPSPQKPSSSLAPNTYKQRQRIWLRLGEENKNDTDITIYYTIDGSTPDADSPVYTGEPFWLPGGRVTLKAVAVNGYGKASNALEILYKIDTGPFPLDSYSTEDTANGLTLGVTTKEEFQEKYGTGESTEEVSLEGFDDPGEKITYSWGYAVMGKIQRTGWVLTELYFTSDQFSGPRETSIGDSEEEVVGQFRDMGQVESPSGNRGLYDNDTGKGKIYLMEDGTKEIRYETNTADGATWNLTYYVSKADAVTAIDMLYEP